MNILQFIKEECDIRKEELQNLSRAVESEKERLAEARLNQKKSFVRKVAFIDKQVSNYEKGADEKALETFKETLMEEINKDRALRKQELIKSNLAWIIGICALILVAVIAISTVVLNIHNKHEVEEYDKAIKYYISGEYDSAIEVLDSISYDDSSEISKFVVLKIDLRKYIGDTATLQTCLSEIGEIHQERVKSDYSVFVRNVDSIIEIQTEIDDLDEIECIHDGSAVNSITDELKTIDDDYKCLLNTGTYDKAKYIVDSIEQNTELGKTLLAIDALGVITIKSKEEIDVARNLYDSLSKSDKAYVLNYDMLEDAEREYESIQEEEAERIKEAETETEVRRSMPAGNTSATYYWVQSGEVYHTDSTCRYLRRSNNVMSGSNPPAGRRPCSVCG